MRMMRTERTFEGVINISDHDTKRLPRGQKEAQ